MIWIVLRRIISAPFVFLAAAVLAFEDWLWRPILAWLRGLAHWPLVRTIELSVSKIRPWPALILFAVPMLLLLPFKFAGLYLIAHGQRLLGGLVFIGAKIIGTALVAWIYSLTEPALSTLPWFVKARNVFWRFKAWAYEQVRSSLIWRWTRRKVHALRHQVRNWLIRIRKTP